MSPPYLTVRDEKDHIHASKQRGFLIDDIKTMLDTLIDYAVGADRAFMLDGRMTR